MWSYNELYIEDMRLIDPKEAVVGYYEVMLFNKTYKDQSCASRPEEEGIEKSQLYSRICVRSICCLKGLRMRSTLSITHVPYKHSLNVWCIQRENTTRREGYHIFFEFVLRSNFMNISFRTCVPLPSFISIH